MACRRQAFDAKRQMLAYGKSKVNPLSKAAGHTNAKRIHAFCRAPLVVEGQTNSFCKGNDKKCERCHEMLQAPLEVEGLTNTFCKGTDKKCELSKNVTLVVVVLVVVVGVAIELVPTGGGWPYQHFL